MKIQHAFEAVLDVNSALAAHTMYMRNSRLPRIIPVQMNTYPGVHFISYFLLSYIFQCTAIVDCVLSVFDANMNNLSYCGVPLLF